MSSVLLTALNGSGAAANLGPLVLALRARGHDVTMVSDPAFRARAEALGARFVAVPDPRLPSLGQAPASRFERLRRLRPNVRASFLEPLPAQWAAVQEVLASTPVDVVITDLMFFGAGILAAVPRSERPPLIAIGMVPPPAPDIDIAPYGSGIPPLAGPLGRLRNLLITKLIAEPAFGALDREFAEIVRLHTGYDVNTSPWALATRADVWAQATVRRFDYPRAREPANLRWIGPLNPVENSVIPEWWDPRTEPPVVVVHADARVPLDHFVVPAIRALQGDGSTAIVSGGVTREETTRAFGAPLPSNVHFETAVPWSRLVPGRSLFVSTGDYVHVQHALRHGIPVVVTGDSEPQVETKARVEWAGVGIDVPEARPTPEMLRAAIERVRADPGIDLAVALIAAQIGKTDAEGAICDIVAELTSGVSRRAARSAELRAADRTD